MLSLSKLFFFTALLFSIQAFSQSAFQKSVNISLETGPLISNGTEWGDELKDLVKYRGIDIQMGWRKNENTLYNYLYRYPTFGIGLNAGTTQTQEIGKPIALYGFVDLPFSIPSQSRKIHFGYFSQLGLGFNLNPYDVTKNPENQYIGSSINCFIHLGLYSKIHLSERVDLKANIGLKHYSNGSTKKPNSGINLAPIGLGVNVKLGDLVSIPTAKPDFSDYPKKFFWNFALYTGIKNYEIGAPSYFRGGFGVNYLIQPGPKYRLGIGMDLFWAQGMEQRFSGSQFSFRDQTSLAVVGSWEWQLSDRLYIPIGLGVYLFRNEVNQEWTSYYERIGVRYRMNQHLFAGVQIKAHKAKADFFEFTFGYTLPSSN